MSNAEEIAEAIVYEDHPPMDNEEAIVAYSKWIDQHTNQTLQELKEKVGKDKERASYMIGTLYDSHPQKQYYKGRKEQSQDLITLIDEAINE